MPTSDRSPKLLTAEHLLAIDDDLHRYELVAGRLVVMEPPAFGHGAAITRIALLLARFAEEHGLGTVVTGDTGFVLVRDPDTVRGPDVAFVRADRVPVGPAGDWFFEGAPDLAVEVLSPSDRPGAVQRKVANYLDAGTPLVWIVDRRARRVVEHRAHAAPRIHGVDDTIDGGDVLPGFRAPVRAFFDVDA